MKFLIDTNVFIPLEPSSVSDIETHSQEAANLFRAIQKERHEIFLHPSSKLDILRDNDGGRKALRLLAFTKYPCLENSPLPDDFREKLPARTVNENDEVDNNLLYATYNHAVDILVTEDIGIHKKARLLHIENRVAHISDALLIITQLQNPNIYLPAVRYVKAYQLDIRDPIFDSLRADYVGFDKWFQKCQIEHRECIIVGNNFKKLDGICILKKEECRDFGLTGTAIKICTFKIAEHAKGVRYGELLLRAIFNKVYAEHYTTVYVTAFRKNQYICDFFEAYGFKAVTDRQTGIGEDIFVKKMLPDEQDMLTHNHLRNFLTYGPRFIPTASNAFLVPIRSGFHQLLFPELNEQLTLFDGSLPVGNGITKAYLCHSSIRQLSPGDIIFFYQSKKRFTIQAIGVVEGAERFSDANQAAAYVGRRTIYSFEEICEMVQRKSVLAILFRQANSFRHEISRMQLQSFKIFSHPPQSICSLSEESKKWLLANERM